MLLVGGEVSEDRLQRPGERLRRETDPVQERSDARGAGLRRHPHLDPDAAGRAQSVGDGLAMEQVPVPSRGLKGVTERVPEVQGDPAARGIAFPLVGGDDLDLRPAGPLDDLRDARRNRRPPAHRGRSLRHRLRAG